MPPESPDLFDAAGQSFGPLGSDHRPLAARMRPRSLAEIVGQPHLLGPGALLPRLVRQDCFGSLLFYGPPGCGKTSLAETIAAETRAHFVRVNAVTSNTAELREHLATARLHPGRRTILFIDEIHRFNKAQQDLLLPDVEEGVVRLIGATTHNPGFYVIAPLLSRSHLFRLEPLDEGAVFGVLAAALADSERGLGTRRCTADPSALRTLARLCDGDLRRALNALEVLVQTLPEGARLGPDDVAVFARERHVRHDANQDEHYDTASVFIKAIRGSDPDAAMYWLGKMLEGGEDPRFIARRLIILASEDVGLADSRGLGIAVACHHACEAVGLPECEYALAHATLFLALAPKSNSIARALAATRREIREKPVQSVPVAFRDRGGTASKRLGHGQEYVYSHDALEGITGQEYLEKPVTLYEPGTQGAEVQLAERLARWKRLKQELQAQQA